jgi:hypothetical protein
VTSLLSLVIHKITRSRKITIHIMAFLFFPGTFLHELSHLIMANLLSVRVYHVEFLPKLEGDGLKLGSVSTEKTDIFRRILIGMSPFLAGSGILLLLLFYAGKNDLFDNFAVTILLGYAIFEIGNTMFSSKKDLEGALELLVIIALIATASYILGFRINPQTLLEDPLLKRIFQQGSILLLTPIYIDLGLIVILRFLKWFIFSRKSYNQLRG